MSTKYKTASPITYLLLKEKAKYNKQHPTEAERVTWELLRRKQLGVIFKRQYIIDEYIVDFVCLDKKLIVEIDGGYHSTGEQQEFDINREHRLTTLGFHILRFSNGEVMVSPDSVTNKIKQSLTSF